MFELKMVIIFHVMKTVTDLDEMLLTACFKYVYFAKLSIYHKVFHFLGYSD